MEYVLPVVPEELQRGEQLQQRSLGFIGGRPTSIGATPQTGGGPVLGGGMMSGWGHFLASMLDTGKRGFSGGTK